MYERVQSNVTDITSGHSVAADSLAGGRLRDLTPGSLPLSPHAPTHTTVTVQSNQSVDMNGKIVLGRFRNRIFPINVKFYLFLGHLVS